MQFQKNFCILYLVLGVSSASPLRNIDNGLSVPRRIADHIHPRHFNHEVKVTSKKFIEETVLSREETSSDNLPSIDNEVPSRILNIPGPLRGFILTNDGHKKIVPILGEYDLINGEIMLGNSSESESAEGESSKSSEESSEEDSTSSEPMVTDISTSSDYTKYEASTSDVSGTYTDITYITIKPITKADVTTEGRNGTWPETTRELEDSSTATVISSGTTEVTDDNTNSTLFSLITEEFSATTVLSSFETELSTISGTTEELPSSTDLSSFETEDPASETTEEFPFTSELSSIDTESSTISGTTEQFSSTTDQSSSEIDTPFVSETTEEYYFTTDIATKSTEKFTSTDVSAQTRPTTASTTTTVPTTDTTTERPYYNYRHLTTGAVVEIVVGMVFLLAIIGSGIGFLYIKKQLCFSC